MWYMYTMKCYCPCLVGKSCPTLLKPHRQQPFSLPCLWDSLGKNAGVGCHFLLQEIKPDPGIKPASPALEGGFFTTEPTGKPIMEYYSVTKRNEAGSFVKMWMDL